MTTAEQIKSLICSHLSEYDERFYTLALQVAAHEAQQGHAALAHDIREGQGVYLFDEFDAIQTYENENT